MFEGRREREQYDLVCVECLWMIGQMVAMLMSYSCVVSAVSGFSVVGLHTLNFLHSSFSLIQQEMFKKVALLAHT